MRIRIVQSPPIASVDGLQLDCFQVGEEYEVGNSLGALLLAEGWAEPVPLDAPAPYVPFSEDDPFVPRVLNRESPPNLVRETHPPFVDDLDSAADFRWRRKSRKT